MDELILHVIGEVGTTGKEDIESLALASKMLDSLRGTLYYDGEGDELLEAAVKMINRRINKLQQQ